MGGCVGSSVGGGSVLVWFGMGVGGWLVAVGLRGESVWLGREVPSGVRVCWAKAKAVSKAAVLEPGGRLSLGRLQAESSARAIRATMILLAGTAISLGHLYYKTLKLCCLFQTRVFMPKYEITCIIPS